MALNNAGFFNAESLVINPVFSGIVQSIKASDFGLSYDKLFPAVHFTSAGNGMGTYMRYNLADNLREVDEEILVRRFATPAFAISRQRSYETFKVKRRHIDAAVSDEEAKLVKDQTNGAEDPQVTEIQWVREVMLLNKERRAATFANTVSNVGTNITPAIAWDKDGANPIADITNLRMIVKAKSGVFPNRMAMPYEVALRLAISPAIQQIRSNTERKLVDQTEIAALLRTALGLEEVIVFTSMYNTVKPGVVPSTSLLSVWGPNVYLFSRPDNMGFSTLGWGIEAIDNYFGKEFTAPAYPIPLPDSEVTKYRIREDSDFIPLNPEVAGALRNVITL